MTNLTNNVKTPVEVVIYTRVSTSRQETDGNGLASQQIACEKYCRNNGYKIVEIFTEPGISGGDAGRPEYNRALAFLANRSKNPKVKTMFLADSLSRFSRDNLTSIILDTFCKKHGIILRSVTERFEDSISGDLSRNIICAINDYQRQENKSRVTERMEAQTSTGRRIYGRAPAWYCFINGDMVRFEPNATILAEVYERIIIGELLPCHRDIQHFMQEKGFVCKRTQDSCAPTRHQTAKVLQERNIREAAGFTFYGGAWIQGTHDPIISLDTAEKVLRIIQEGGKRKARLGLDELYPLRGEMRCAACGSLMTGSSPNKNGEYHYYYCVQKGCTYKTKGTRTNLVHQQFEELLKNIKPSPSMIKAAKAVLEILWEKRKTDFDTDRRRWRTQITTCEEGIQSAIADSRTVPSENVKRALHEEVDRLMKKKQSFEHRLNNASFKEVDLQRVMDTIFETLSNPLESWENGSLQQKKMLLKLMFNGNLRYLTKEGFRNPGFALPFRVFEGKTTKKAVLVEPSGFEPLTSSLPAKRSTS